MAHSGDNRLAPGSLVGSYRLVRVLGEGGMAVVWEAVHERLGRRVAIKVLKPGYASRRDAVASFFQEARIASRLNHPHIVSVEDLVLEPGRAACVMELLEGRTLADHLAAHGAMDVPEVLLLAHQVADALAAAHAAGVVHRDIKPGNIFLARTRTGGWTAKVLDFGIANLESPSLRVSGSLARKQAGTPAYMSPEQIAGRPTDSRSDIYSFGVVLYEAVTGAPPFQAESYAEYLQLHTKVEPTPPHRCMPGPRRLHRACSQLIMRCLAKDPNERFQDGAELRDAVERVARSTGLLLKTGSHPVLIPGRTGALGLKGLLLAGLLAVCLGAVALVGLRSLFTAARPAPKNVPSKTLARERPAPRHREPPRKEPPRKEPRHARPPARLAKKTEALEFLIESSPSGAEVYDDRGQLLGVTPLRLRRQPDRLPLSIRIRKKGFRSARLELARDGPKRRAIRLRRRRSRRSRRGRNAVLDGTENPFEK